MSDHTLWNGPIRRHAAPDGSEVDPSPELQAVWIELDAVTPAGWQVGQPSLHDERHQWEQYAFDPSERPRAGARAREWQAVAPEELGAVGVVREMARCLAEIKSGRVPK